MTSSEPPALALLAYAPLRRPANTQRWLGPGSAALITSPLGMVPDGLERLEPLPSIKLTSAALHTERALPERLVNRLWDQADFHTIRDLICREIAALCGYTAWRRLGAHLHLPPGAQADLAAQEYIAVFDEAAATRLAVAVGGYGGVVVANEEGQPTIWPSLAWSAHTNTWRLATLALLERAGYHEPTPIQVVFAAFGLLWRPAGTRDALVASMPPLSTVGAAERTRDGHFALRPDSANRHWRLQVQYTEALDVIRQALERPQRPTTRWGKQPKRKRFSDTFTTDAECEDALVRAARKVPQGDPITPTTLARTLRRHEALGKPGNPDHKQVTRWLERLGLTCDDIKARAGR